MSPATLTALDLLGERVRGGEPAAKFIVQVGGGGDADAPPEFDSRREGNFRVINRTNVP